MANETRMFRLPAGVNVQTVAGAVERFLSTSKGMETQIREIPDGYVVQLSMMNDSLNVTVGQGEWLDKIGAGVVGFFFLLPLAVTAGVGAYQQQKLPNEIFQVIEQTVGSGGSAVAWNSGSSQPTWNSAPVESAAVCPACKTPYSPGARFCNNCGASLNQTCPNCGAQVKPGSKFCSDCGQPL